MAIDGQIIIERKNNSDLEEQEPEQLVFDGSDFIRNGNMQIISKPSFKEDSTVYRQEYIAEKDGEKLCITTNISVNLTGQDEEIVAISQLPENYQIEENSLYIEEDDDDEEAYELVEDEEED